LGRDRSGALREIRAVLATSDDLLRIEELRAAGTLLAQMGETKEAGLVLTRMQALSPAVLATGFGRSCVGNLQGEIRAAEGRLAEARASFAAAAQAFPQHMSLAGIAQLQQKRKDWTAATLAWQNVVDEGGDIVRFGFPADWPLARLERARTLRRAGLDAEAAREYAALREQWRAADPGSLPDEARRESDTQIGVVHP
jgi:hypothetical protein